MIKDSIGLQLAKSRLWRNSRTDKFYLMRKAEREEEEEEKGGVKRRTYKLKEN